MTAARQRVVLSVLSEVADGDVFYTVIQPGIVYRRNMAAATAEFEFQAIGTEQWYSADQLGAPRERVVIIHNTRKTVTRYRRGRRC